MITNLQLAAIAPQAVKLAAGISEACDRFDIRGPLRQAHFLAQCAHESAGFRVLRENLNYSAEALRRIFTRYFPDDATAAAYARQPEKIANRVYANRMGNRDEASGDGWCFRGAGLIQLTGHDNMLAYSMAVHGSAVVLTDPDMLTRDPDAVLSAAWFWSMHNCNAAADRDDVAAVTRIINGGQIGLQERKQLTERAKAVLA